MKRTIQQKKLILANNYLAFIERSHAEGYTVDYVRKDLELPKFIFLNECQDVPIGFVALEELGFERVSSTAHELAFTDVRMVFVIQHDLKLTMLHENIIINEIESITELLIVYFKITGKELTLKQITIK